MGQPEWQPPAGLDPGRLREARLQAHYAVQWLARAARAFVAPRPNDEHSNLGWDDKLGGLKTHALPSGGRIGLQLAALTLAVLGKDSARLQALALSGRTEAQVRAWLGEQLRSQGLDARALDHVSPYEMPSHAIASGACYDGTGHAAALGELAVWYANAVHALLRVRETLLDRGRKMSPVRCWPHHFDFDTLLVLGADGASSVGAGFSPGDEYYDEPYLYVTLYPAPDAATLPPLGAIGRWHTRDFTAAVAPASRILAAIDQRAEVDGFLMSAIETAIAAVS